MRRHPTTAVSTSPGSSTAEKPKLARHSRVAFPAQIWSPPRFHPRQRLEMTSIPPLIYGAAYNDVTGMVAVGMIRKQDFGRCFEADRIAKDVLY